MAFPTLTANPVYPITENREDNSIKSQTDAGYVLARPRFTRVRRNWSVVYRNVSLSDKNLLKAHFDSVGTNSLFTWTNPADSTTYTVRYGKPPVFTQRIPAVFDIDLQFDEV